MSLKFHVISNSKPVRVTGNKRKKSVGYCDNSSGFVPNRLNSFF